MVYEQGAMDSLWAAHRALERAINEYASGNGEPMNVSEGPLFATLDNINTVLAELADFRAIAASDK